MIEQAGDATWIRFLSAADHQGDNARWVLSDVSVVLQGSLRDTTERKVSTEQFEAITKVNSEGQAIEAIRAGNAEPVPLAVPTIPAPMIQPTLVPRAPIVPSQPPTRALKSRLDRKFDLSTGEAQPLRVAALAKSSGLAPKVEVGTVVLDADADLAIPVEPAANQNDAVKVVEPPPAQPIGFVLAKPDAPSERPTTREKPITMNPDSPHKAVSETSVEAAAAVKPVEPTPKPVEPTPKTVEPEPPVNGAPKAVITESAEQMVMESESSTRPTEQVEPLRVDIKSAAMVPLELPAATAAEPSTISVTPAGLSPVQRTPVAVLTAGLDLDATKPTQVPEDASHDDREAKRRAHTEYDRRERGIQPITSAPKRTPLQPRQIMVASAGVAAACIIATIGTIVWARGAVSDARAESARSRDPAASVERVRPLEPAIDTFPSGPVTATPPAEVTGQVVEPVGDEDPAANADVTPLTAATVNRADCSLSVTASVSGSTVFVDGAPQARRRPESPPPAIRRSSSRFAIRATRTSRARSRRAAAPSRIEATLEREKTALTVWSNPPAQVVYNGKPLGTTPLTAKVPRYEQGTLRFQAKGMAPDWRRILPKTAKKTVSVTLTKK